MTEDALGGTLAAPSATMKRLPLYLIIASTLVPVLSAAPANPANPANPATERIREGEVKQEQLRGDAQRLVEQLDAMLGEYERNGLAGEETKTVQALRETLARLGGSEMKQVVELLEKARGTVDAGQQKKDVSAAYTAQKSLITQMKKLLADHLRNQEALEISQQLTQLADRQSVNLQNGITLGQWTGGRKPENFEAAMQANLEGQQGEQAAIAAEVKMAAEKIAKFAKDPANAETAARFQKGLVAVEKVLPNVEAAAAALKQGQLFKAVTEEKTARDAMRKLAREIAPPQDRAEALRAAQKELAKMIEDQKDVVQKAEKAAGEKDFDKWLDKRAEQGALESKQKKMTREQQRADKDLQRKFAEQKDGRKDELVGLEDTQGDLARKSDDVAQQLEKDAPAAGQNLKAAQEKMQDARVAMNEKNGEAAAKNAKDAMAAIQAAEAKVQQEIAKADAAAGKGSGDLAKDLAQLQKDTKDLAKQQAAAAQNPDKSGQAALADKAQQLAQQAANAAPQAAPAMQQAAANAQKAAQAAQANQPAPAAAAQQAAAQNLAQAAEQLAQAAAEAQQAQQALAAAQKAQQELAEIIVAEQKLELDTAKGVALAAAKKGKASEHFSGQAARQQEVRTKTDSFKANLAPELAAATPALGEAGTAMGEAKTQLDKPDGEPAKAAELKALDALFRAQKALADVAAQAQEQLGQENAAQNANAQQQAQAQLAQAQAQAALAQQYLQKAADAQAAAEQAQQAGDKPAAQKANQKAAQAAQKAAGELAQAAQKAGEAAAQGTPQNEAAQAAAQEAAQAAAEAAAQAAAQNTPAAQAAAAAAQQALAQAQAAMAQAQSGLSESSAPPTPGEGQPSDMAQAGQPGQPGQPGSKPGTKPGQKPGKGPGKKPGPPGGTGAAEKYEPGSPEAIQLGSRTTAAKKAAFAALPPRERAVIEQSQAEKYPEEFGAQVEQYLLNLANESAAKK